MYHSFFGMKQRPFGSTPQLRNYFAALGQEEALATLRYAITQGRGVGLLTGQSGTGKTLVCHRLTSCLESAFTIAMITNTNMATIKALYQAILYDLSIPYHGLDEQELRLSLTDFLFGKYAGGGRMVLIIDEAQNLSAPLLEELRMLSNLESETDKLFQIVLVGHARLIDLLRSPELETLNQRIGARTTLGALGDAETIGYIQHQLQYAGLLPDAVFTHDALTAVYEASGGIPRLINQLCEHALLLAYVSESRRVDAPLVEKASSDLNLAWSQETQDSPANAASTPLAAALQDIAIQAADRVPDCEHEAGICVSYAPAEDQNDCLEINSKEPVPVRHMEFEAASPSRQNTDTAAYPLDEVFAQEEIIVDLYAMLDAARSALSHSQQPIQHVQPVREAEQPRKSSIAPDLLLQPMEPPYVVAGGGALATAMVSESQTLESPTPICFVEPSDNPAVHEVGAGVEAQPAESTDLPILVIESRSQRIAGNLARVDVPQQTNAGGRRTYRLLFTHARKS